MLNSKVNSLNKVRKYLNSIPYINDGGCAIAALSMYRWLQKHSDPGYDCCVIYLYAKYDTSLYRRNLAYINNSYGYLSSCTHAGLYYNEKLFDCQEYIDRKEYVNELVLDEDHVVESINYLDSWCSSFNRLNILSIARVLDIDLSDLKTNYCIE